MIAFHEISSCVLHVLLSFAYPQFPKSHNSKTLKKDTRRNQIKTLSLSLAFNVVENIIISDSRHVYVADACRKCYLYIYHPFLLLLLLPCFKVFGFILNTFIPSREIIKRNQTASLAFSDDVCIHRMASTFWNCINFELALLSYCDDFFPVWLDINGRMNSMWHKTKLLVTHEYILEYFHSMEIYGDEWTYLPTEVEVFDGTWRKRLLPSRLEIQ